MAGLDTPDWIIEAALEFADHGSIETKPASAERDGDVVTITVGDDVPADAPVEPGETWEINGGEIRYAARRRAITSDGMRP